jgi:hypothetical protein
MHIRFHEKCNHGQEKKDDGNQHERRVEVNLEIFRLSINYFIISFTVSVSIEG